MAILKYILTGNMCKRAKFTHSVKSSSIGQKEGMIQPYNTGFHSWFCDTDLKKSQNKIWDEKREFEASY